MEIRIERATTENHGIRVRNASGGGLDFDIYHEPDVNQPAYKFSMPASKVGDLVAGINALAGSRARG